MAARTAAIRTGAIQRQYPAPCPVVTTSVLVSLGIAGPPIFPPPDARPGQFEPGSRRTLCVGAAPTHVDSGQPPTLEARRFWVRSILRCPYSAGITEAVPGVDRQKSRNINNLNKKGRIHAGPLCLAPTTPIVVPAPGPIPRDLSVG